MRHKISYSLACAMLGIGLLYIAGTPVVAVAEPAGETAHEQTVVFAVENMTCALCPITVRTAMMAVEGVHQVDVDFDAKTATVSFDPSVATQEQIGEASLNAGYPASPQGS